MKKRKRRREEEEEEMSNNKTDSCFFSSLLFFSPTIRFDQTPFFLPFQDIPDTIIQLKQIELVIYVRLLYQSISNDDDDDDDDDEGKNFFSTFHAAMILNNSDSTSMNFVTDWKKKNDTFNIGRRQNQ